MTQNNINFETILKCPVYVNLEQINFGSFKRIVRITKNNRNLLSYKRREAD